MKKEFRECHIRVGQRWQHKKTGVILEVCAMSGPYVKAKDPFGGRKNHSMYKRYFLKFWTLCQM